MPKPQGLDMRSPVLSLVLGLSLPAISVHAETRLSGTYVAHGATFAEMLQLTQTDNGQISGVMSGVDMKPNGNLDAENEPVNGTVDNNQLILNYRVGLLGGRLAGNVTGSTIQLQTIGMNGDALVWRYTRAAPSDYQAFADQLKAKSRGILFTAKLEMTARDMDSAVRDSAKWQADTETHLRKMPGVKAYYEKIAGKMGALVIQERGTASTVVRSQISVAVSQDDIAGTQADLHFNQLWDQLAASGLTLGQAFAKFPTSCPSLAELQAHGAAQAIAEKWRAACTQALDERSTFSASLQREALARAELRDFQKVEQRLRETLVQQANDAQ